MPRAGLFMKLEAKKLLFDVITACQDIAEFTALQELGVEAIERQRVGS